MNEFTKLRERARQKRDKEIAQVRAQYEYALVQIATLEQDLLGRDSTRHKTISSCIDLVIPRDRTFTTVDVMTALEAMDQGRAWRKRSVDGHIARLRERGLVRRIRKSQNTEPAIYARVGVEVPPRPFQDQTLAQAIQTVIAPGMNATQVSVALLEAGYETTMSAQGLRRAVNVEMRKAAAT